MESNSQDIILASDASKKRKRPTDASHIQTAPKEPPSPEFLCQDCVSLDLSQAFSVEDAGDESASVPWGYFNNWVVDVGHRYRVTRATNCNLCQMLITSRVDEGDPELHSDRYWIRAVSFMKMSGLVEVGCEQWKPRDFPFLMLFSNKNYSLKKNRKRVRALIQQSGYAALRQLNQQQAVPLSLKVIPPVFELAKFQNWFGYCNKNHRLLCRSPKSHLCGTRVIDCQEQSITEHKPGMPYVALSYVWGQPQAQKAVNDGKRLPTQLSLLIRDAMAVTQAMGFRYLWVDRYCMIKTIQQPSMSKFGKWMQYTATPR
ncbi:hypothetical protein N5P37_010050 [Trichoderma harzianum]|uniref:Heterokaryon incompatibility domain-containing protein n=1 Tax=Trichoderma harzianum CBS 226.95 TaxID=983964 RepID=A0A2T4A5K4_TRIHA|nr:hypothetical protein M431DRAFT_510438 [Trichoderma harzianum CBS 226.95]KAK0757329.1 hypothetical protein N5P37_010050 [Trichoderma harzianum]PKK43002.1 hypothetical protein CI102_11287 [Trichoderma harzianum]PTB52253.1 hypothetical protein M431DRAFT_510438 [Trichoderma harzianum CBS 226.95]